MMMKPSKLLIALGLVQAVAGCSQPPNRVVARDPIPQPPPGYKVRCTSHPFIFDAYLGHCTPVSAPVVPNERNSVRVKG